MFRKRFLLTFIIVTTFLSSNFSLVYSSEQRVLLSDIEDNKELMKNIVIHVLNDTRSKKRIVEKFGEHSQMKYEEWKQAVQNERVDNHLTKRKIHGYFNDLVSPKNASLFLNNIDNANLYFRKNPVSDGTVLIYDFDYGKPIGVVGYNNDRVIKEVLDPKKLILMIIPEKIVNCIKIKGLDDISWKNEHGIIATMMLYNDNMIQELQLPVDQ
jgi:Lhr-like helicase